MKRLALGILLAIIVGLILGISVPVKSQTTTTTGTTQKLCLPSNTTVAYSKACPSGTTSTKKICPSGEIVAYTAACTAAPPPPPPPPAPSPTGVTRKLCPDGTIVGYTAKCATAGTVMKVCPSGEIVAYSKACPSTPTPPPPKDPCWDNFGPVTYSQCPAKTCPGVVNPVPVEQPCPAVTWVTTSPLTAGGYAFLRNQGPCCKGLILRLIRWEMSTDADPALRHPIWYGIYQEDASGNFPVNNPYWTAYQFRLNEADLQGVKPQ